MCGLWPKSLLPIQPFNSHGNEVWQPLHRIIHNFGSIIQRIRDAGDIGLWSVTSTANSWVRVFGVWATRRCVCGSIQDVHLSKILSIDSQEWHTSRASHRLRLVHPDRMKFSQFRNWLRRCVRAMLDNRHAGSLMSENSHRTIFTYKYILGKKLITYRPVTVNMYWQY